MSFICAQNILSDSVLTQLHELCLIKDTDQSSYDIWPDEVTGNKTLVETFSEQINHKHGSLKKILQNDLYERPSSPLHKSKLVLHADFAILKYPPGSSCPYHYDTAQCAMTLFLNQQWEPNWGGGFVYFDDAGVEHTIPVQYNSAAYTFYDELTTGPKHGAEQVSGPETRYVLQVFARKKSNTDASVKF